jgi:hypothetical protein
MMTATDVLEVLGRLEAAGLAVWVDGGWGVDALVGLFVMKRGEVLLTAP